MPITDYGHLVADNDNVSQGAISLIHKRPCRLLHCLCHMEWP